MILNSLSSSCRAVNKIWPCVPLNIYQSDVFVSTLLTSADTTDKKGKELIYNPFLLGTTRFYTHFSNLSVCIALCVCFIVKLWS